MTKRRVFFSGNDVCEPAMVTIEDNDDTDSAGNDVYNNTHWASAADAWDAIERDIQAQAMLTGREIQRLESMLTNARKEAGEACKRWDRLQRRKRDETLAELLALHEGNES